MHKISVVTEVNLQEASIKDKVPNQLLEADKTQTKAMDIKIKELS